MKTKHHVHNLIILDESGSMFGIKEQIIRGFNEIVQTVKHVEEEYPEQEHFITFITFNGLGITEHLFNARVKNLKAIDGDSYNPDSSTPLYDAIGHGLSRVKKIVEDKKKVDVLVTIFTDGEENSSKEYTGEAIKKKIEELKNKQWTFTYTGTDHDVYRSANSLSIGNVVQFNKDDSAMDLVFQQEREARFIYSEKIRSKKNKGEDFYTKNE